MCKIVCGLCLTLCLMGCSLWPAKNAAERNRKNWERVIPAHEKYLDAAQKAGELTKDNVSNRKLFLKEALGLAKNMEDKGR